MWKIFKKVYGFFARPFKEDFIFLFIMTLLVCGPRFVFHSYVFYQGYSVLIWEIVHSYLLCYFVAIALQLMPIKFKQLYKYIFYSLAFIDFCIDAACIIVTGTPFTIDHVAIIMGSNLSEGKEFINTYIISTLLWIILSAIIIICLLQRSSKYINRFGKKIALATTIFSVFSCVYFVSKGSVSWECRFYNKFFAFMSYETPPDLRPYQQRLEINLSKSDLPDNVVLILGESYSKSHCSLYGYDKVTAPCLSRMISDSLLISYDNVIAPGTHTIECIKSIMSTYNLEYKNTVNWYECYTLPNIMKQCGYQTWWISNQSPSGVFDNIAARYSELCDSALFVGNTIMGVNKMDFDEYIIPILKDFVGGGKKFIIIHLMGSHPDYKMRYPEKWNHFNESDYPELKDNQKKVVASYDNSILYNDYVVSEMLKCFESEETLALYFSDHGQDIFESSDDYYGHALKGNRISEVAATQIPYFVYMSQKYQENFPKETDCLKTKMSEEISTGNTIEFLCEILGLSFKN